MYESDILEETLGRLTYAAERQWFAVVTGDCGTGKTTTIRRFTEVLILVGQSELWDRLNLQAYAAIRQRIDLQRKLPHYDRAQTGASHDQQSLHALPDLRLTEQTSDHR